MRGEPKSNQEKSGNVSTSSVVGVLSCSVGSAFLDERCVIPR